MTSSFDPYYTWLGIPEKHQPPSHYRLLGLEMLEDDPDVIQYAADRQMGHLRTMQTGQRAAEAQRLLNEIASAAGCLLDAPNKQVYDGQLMSEMRQPRVPWAEPGAPAVATQPGAARPSPAATRSASPPAPMIAPIAKPPQARPPSTPRPPSRPADPRIARPEPQVPPNSLTIGADGIDPVASSDVSEGTTIGEYQVIRKIDSSRSGSIYKAKHCASGCFVALKILSPEANQSEEIASRFARKVRILSDLHHSNLVQIYDSGVAEGTPFLVTEFIDGQNLAQMLLKVGPLPVEHAVNYAMQAAAGLEHAHVHGIYHRNVKPANLMINSQTSVVKVIGLGLARMNMDWLGTNAYEQLTTAGVAMGTCDYMAPEQSKDATSVDHRSDIYSLGCTLHALLTNRVVYPIKGPMRKVLAHQTEAIPPLSDARGDIPFELEMVYQKMLAKRRRDRYQSMGEVFDALKAV